MNKLYALSMALEYVRDAQESIKEDSDLMESTIRACHYISYCIELAEMEVRAQKEARQ